MYLILPSIPASMPVFCSKMRVFLFKREKQAERQTDSGKVKKRDGCMEDG